MSKSEYEGMAHCALGAIEVATKELDADKKIQAVATKMLEAHIGTTSIPGWNDKSKTKEGDVIEAFQMTAKEIRNSITDALDGGTDTLEEDEEEQE